MIYKRSFTGTEKGLTLIEQKMQKEGYKRQQLSEKADLSIDRINAFFRGEGLQRNSIEAIAQALNLQPKAPPPAPKFPPQSLFCIGYCDYKLTKKQHLWLVWWDFRGNASQCLLT
jgi:hypothetical protein